MAERAGDLEATARALGGLGDAEYVRGRMITAGNYFRRSVDASVRAGLGRDRGAKPPDGGIRDVCSNCGSPTRCRRCSSPSSARA